MCVLAAIGAFSQLSAVAKPVEQNAPPAAANKADASKNTAPATATSSTSATKVSTDERRRALRERFEKLRQNPRLRKQSVGEPQKKSSSELPVSAEQQKANQCLECGRG